MQKFFPVYLKVYLSLFEFLAFFWRDVKYIINPSKYKFDIMVNAYFYVFLWYRDYKG